MMPSTTTTCTSPAATWTRCQEEKKHKSTTLNWRDRAVSEESKCDWRARKQEKTEQVDMSRVYGDCMPAEWKLDQMYQQLKRYNKEFTTWLVETVYPNGDDIPYYITLARKQTKAHDKYDIIVNNTTELARQIPTVPATIMTLLDRLIATRTEYSYWMCRKSTEDDLAKPTNDKHAYYIEVLKDVQKILAAKRTKEPEAPQRRTSSPSQAQSKRNNNTVLTFQGSARWTRSATPPERKHDLDAAHNHPATTAKSLHQHDSWRRIIAGSCDRTKEETGANGMDHGPAMRFATAA